ncbi:DUF6538 domain-containing protein [Paraburkholderia tropica]|uniref:DUF6538 domain-containing protein n=1 Tax=Paraburkholderia tropica TaxID=92647 RepID=UPI002ABDCC2D|nr:DUF6538 domain-containing protein [Paraburkholderia tropica]
MCTHLIKRGSRYYIRRRVPSDLVSILGKSEVTKSLGTSVRAEAVELCRLAGVRLDTDWAKLRTELQLAADTTHQGQPWAPFPNREAEEAHDQAEAVYSSDDRDHDAAQHAEAVERTEAVIREAHRRAGIPLPEKVPTLYEKYRAQQDAAPRAQLAAHQTIAKAGEKGAPASRANPSAPTLRAVVPSWIARNAPKDNAIGRTEKAIALFEEAVGRIPLVDLKKAHGAAFVRFLLDQDARGFGRKTAHNHAACITTLLSVAVKDDLLDRNPLDLSFDKSIGADKREPWADAQLSLMFGHALFSARMDTVEHWQGVQPSDGRALLLILLHTGARIGEIAQLRRGDFQVQRGMTTISITAEAGTVKTAESERTIPFAAHLLADPWFSVWLSKVLAGGRPDEPAFPTMSGRARGPGDTAVQWFLGFRKDAGLPLGALHGSHKFRHWIRSTLAASNIGDATADAITGHAAQGSSGRVSYTTISLAVMLDALNVLTYPKVAAD